MPRFPRKLILLQNSAKLIIPQTIKEKQNFLKKTRGLKIIIPFVQNFSKLEILYFQKMGCRTKGLIDAQRKNALRPGRIIKKRFNFF